VTHLILGDEFEQGVDHVPASVTHLAMRATYRVSVGNVVGQLEFLGFFDGSGFDWSWPQRWRNAVWLESGQRLTANQLSRRTSETFFRWKKPAG